jgi:deazaflavin-dependent oxidoreductase (nitroreductase family)
VREVDGTERPLSAYQERLGRLTVQWMSGLNMIVYRLSEGRVGGRIPGGAPIGLVTTIGRRSGRTRTVPLLCMPDGDTRVVLVASRGGMSANPAWYDNICADPRVSVELAGRRREMSGRAATPAERARLWSILTAVYPRFDVYQRRTDRTIPLVILEDASPDPR